MKTKRILFTLIFVFTLLGFFTPTVNAVGCKGPQCTGLNPQTMGCGADAQRSGSIKYLSDGGTNLSFVETRKSVACDAKWARTSNYSGGYRYAAATIRYGCANYCYSQSTRSPGTIANSQTVYTPMVGYIATPTRSCGKVLTTGPISIPLSLSDTYCTGSN
jgi:hypothetical protein